MGLRIRKGFGFGPFRINLSKSGVGVSAGVKGARVGLGADGRTKATVGIPGSGISYQQGLGKRNQTMTRTVLVILAAIAIVVIYKVVLPAMAANDPPAKPAKPSHAPKPPATGAVQH